MLTRFARKLAMIGVLSLTTATMASAQGVLRIGMTASDIPLTTGQTDQGGEGLRFMGYTVYDALINWDLAAYDETAGLVPGLATEWTVDETDQTKWTFKIREGVTFHDGAPMTAQDIVWNFDKLLVEDSPQYDSRQAAQGKTRIPSVASYAAIDDYTLEITTHTPDATLPFQLAWIMISSPANWEAQGRSWEAVASNPSGTGPWKLTSFVPREKAEMVPNTDYWDEARVPKLDQLVLIPLAEPNARANALLSGQVDWIEAPAPDMVPMMQAQGFTITQNEYPHNWTWHLSMLDGSPWVDERVRKAANLAVDRAGLEVLLGGLMIQAKGFLQPSSPWFGEPEFDVTYDPDAAKALLAEAGYGPDNPVRVKALISPSGSGQMLPLPMNEYIQQNLAAVGIEAEFMVVEWNQMINLWRAGAADPLVEGSHSINFTYSIQDPFVAFIRFLQCDLVAPNGTNWGHYCDEEMEGLFAEIRQTFDPDAQAEVMRRIHEKIVDEALFLMVAHDVAPRAMSPQVKGFRQAQGWNQDFSGITME